MSLPSSPELDREMAQTYLATISKQTAESALQKEFIAKRLEDLKEKGYDKSKPLLEALSRGLALRLEDEFLNQPEAPAVEPKIRAQQLMDDLTANEEFFESFRSYITGLHWGSDTSHFVGALFKHGADFDAALLDKKLDPINIARLELPINYSIRGLLSGDKRPVSQIFEEYPELDYRRLSSDPAFAQSEEGIMLASAYKKLCGRILHEEYSDLRTQVHPQIPLSKFPIIEALIVDDIRDYGPTPKYSFGATPWLEEVWQSDSDKAQDALSSRINTRLPIGSRNAYDGPTEFEFKGHSIRDLCCIHNKETPNAKSHNQLKKQLLSILAAYTSKGPIATSVREEDKHRIGKYENREVGEVRRIVSQILESLLVNGDPEEREIAETVMNFYTLAQGLEMPIEGQEEVLVKKDCLAFKKDDQQILLMNALFNINKTTDPSVFERMGTSLFGPVNAARLRQLAEQTIAEMPYVFPLSEDARQKMKEGRHAINLFLIEQLEGMSADANSTKDTSYLFKDFINKTYLPEDSGTNSEEYRRLIAIGKKPDLATWNKSSISYRITEQLQYRKLESSAELKQVILDLLEIYLGPQGLPASGIVGHLENNYLGLLSQVAKRNLGILPALREDAQFRQEILAYQEKVEIALSIPTTTLGTITLENAKRLLNELLSKQF
jgi:hypothetical protein